MCTKYRFFSWAAQEDAQAILEWLHSDKRFVHVRRLAVRTADSGVNSDATRKPNLRMLAHADSLVRRVEMGIVCVLFTPDQSSLVLSFLV